MTQPPSDPASVVALWQASPLVDGRRLPSGDLGERLDDLLFENALDASLGQACAAVPDGSELWRAALEVAQSCGYDDDNGGPREARMWAIPVTGSLQSIDTWIARSGTTASLIQGLNEWSSHAINRHGLPTTPLDVSVFPVAFHPAAVAAGTPEDLRDLLWGLIDREDVAGNPVFQTHRQLSRESPSSGLEFMGSRVLLCCIVASEDQVCPSSLNTAGLFEALCAQAVDESPDAAALDEAWKILCSRSGFPETCWAGPPMPLSPALMGCLSHHLITAWTVDLNDRGAGLSGSERIEDLLDLLTEIDVVPVETPDNDEFVQVQARSRLGHLVPVVLPVAWATAGGDDALAECIGGIVNRGDNPLTPDDGTEPSETEEEGEPAYPSVRPPRRLH